MLGEGVFVENLHAVTENDRVRHLHHRGFDVQGEHHASFVRVVDFFFVKFVQRFFAHVHAVDHFTIQQGHFFFQHNGFASGGDQLHTHVAGFVQSHGFLAVVEIASVHVRHVRARRLAPIRHRMRVFTRVFFHGFGCAAV